MSAEANIDPKILQAAEKYRNSLKSLSNAQDLLLKKILRNEAFEILEEAVIVTEAAELKQNLHIFTPCKN